MESVASAVQQRAINKVGLLASPTTNKSGIYHKVLKRNNVELLTLPRTGQQALERVIRHTIAMQVTRSDIDLVKLMHQKLISAGAEGVILGCTELSTLSLGNEDKLIDPLKEILSVIMPLNQRNNV